VVRPVHIKLVYRIKVGESSWAGCSKGVYNAIQRTEAYHLASDRRKHFSVDRAVCFVNTCPLESDLSDG